MTAGPNQSASASGSGNTLVQIIGENNNVTIAGATGLTLRAYEDPAFAKAPADPSRAGEPGRTATGRRETRILSPFNRTSLKLRGRESELDRLHAWLTGPASISVHALIGAGGRGKTRLAVELAAYARGLGWTAGFARRDELDVFRRAGCRTARTGPTLVIIDYAAAKSAAIAAWLRGLVHDTTPAPHAPLRLLLLERQGGEGMAWWREVFGSDGDLEAEAIRDLLPREAPLTIGPLADRAQRYRVFADAFAQASATEPPADADSLDHALMAASLGGEPLFLAMFGLVAARQGLDVAKALPADRIALDLAEQELLRIRRVWGARGLPVIEDRPLPDHLAAIATLSEGVDEPTAHAAIARESAALNQAIQPGQTEHARAALHAALPGQAGGIAAIQPDILGEAAMIRAFARLPDGGVAAIRRAVAGPARDAVTRAVIRACQDFLIRGQRAPLAWLQALRTEATDLEALVALANAMPTDTVELREIATELAQAIADLARQVPGETGTALLAGALNNLSVCLYDLGHREAALAVIEEAVAIRRTLAAARPDAFLPDLALSLNNLSNSLAELGRREAALAAIEEAVAIRRTLAAARPDAFVPALALSLNNLSVQLSNLGRREAALAAIEEAVATYRSLAAARPDAVLPKLAGSLNTLSNSLADLGRRETALAAIEEAVATYRSLAAARPDAFLPDLAMSLNNLSIRLADLGRGEAALAAIEEAVATYRSLAAARPDTFLPDLASSLNTLSNGLSHLGRREAALAANEEAVAIRRTLAAARPDAFLPDLAMSLGARGAILRDHAPTAAAASFAEGIATLRGPLLALPAAFAPLMDNLAQDYLAACEAAGIDPDAALLAPIIATFQRLSPQPPPPEP